MSAVVATVPATKTPSEHGSTCQRRLATYDGRWVGSPGSRRHQAPTLPTTTAKAAEPPATPRAVGRSATDDGIAAQAANAKTRNSGPGGCQPSASDANEPSAATVAAAGTAIQARSGAVPTSVPSPTATVR